MLQAVFSSIVQISPKMPWLFLAYHFPLYRRGDITITERWYKPNYGFVLRNRKQAKHPCTDLCRGYKWLYGDTYAGNHRENGIPAHRRDSVSLSPLNSCTASIITTIFSTGRKYLRTLEHLSTHLFRRAEWQTLLGIDAAAPEGDILAVSLFEVLRIYTRPAAELCTGLSASKPASMNRGMIGSITSTFSPDEPCTRAQVVSFLYRDFA